MIVPTLSVTVITLLVLLGVWQRAIDRRDARETLERVSEARERGTDRAVAQHPQIDPFACIGCGSCIAACPEGGVLGLVGGIAHVVQGSRCIGHGRCEEVCPVGALRVGLGDVSRRPDIPILSDGYESSVPGLYIVGELGGIALISNAVRQGIAAVESAAARLKREPVAVNDPEVVDLLVVGAGPAGIAASLKAKELGLSCTTIDQGDLGGTVRKYPRRKLTLTQPVSLPLVEGLDRCEYRKEELIALWERVVREAGLQVRAPVKLLGGGPIGDVFHSQTSVGTIPSRCVVLALGRRGTPRKLGVPGEDSEKVLYQLVDAATYVDQQLLVVGGGDSAIEAATALASQPGTLVTLSYRKAHFHRLKSRNEERLSRYVTDGRIQLLTSSQVLSITGPEVELEVVSHSRSPEESCDPQRVRLANDYVFVFAGGEPPYPLLKKLNVRLGEDAGGDT